MPSHDTLLKACCVCPYTFIKSLFSPSALGVACLLFSLHGEFSLSLAGECLCVCNQKKWERKCSKIDSGAQSTEMPKCISNSIPRLQPRLYPHTADNTASSAPQLPFPTLLQLPTDVKVDSDSFNHGQGCRAPVTAPGNHVALAREQRALSNAV